MVHVYIGLCSYLDPLERLAVRIILVYLLASVGRLLGGVDPGVRSVGREVDVGEFGGVVVFLGCDSHGSRDHHIVIIFLSVFIRLICSLRLY